MCGSVRGIRISVGPVGGGGGGWGSVRPAARFCMRSRSFWEIYSNTDRGVVEMGVSPNIEPL